MPVRGSPACASAAGWAWRWPWSVRPCWNNTKGIGMESKKRTALVTGGMGGLGEAICIKLAALGDTVATTSSPSNSTSQRWLGDMRERVFDFHAYACDVSDWDSCVACIAKVTAEIGPVEVLGNNGGVTRGMTFRKMDRINW